MRLFGKKFIPGVRVEVEENSTEKDKKADILDIVSNHSEQSTATTYEPNSEETNECDEYDEDNFESALETFEAFTRIRRSKKATDEVIFFLKLKIHKKDHLVKNILVCLFR